MKLQRRTLTMYLLVFIAPFIAPLYAQNDTDPVLFEVADRQVTVSEFTQIYKKTNTGEADFSKQSLEEYLDLYLNFKLKVQQAYELGLDTTPELRTELEGYKRQLANSYLIDRAVADKLVKETFERFQYDIDISHIFVPLPENYSNADTLSVFEKITSIYNRLPEFGSFEEAAKALSEDPGTAYNGGRIGYITAMLYPGVYNLENAAYQTQVGDYSRPVRTYMGYHIVHVNGKRKAIGEREVAHIFVQAQSTVPEDLKNAEIKINQAYEELQKGTAFDRVALHFSDDRENNTRGGYLGKVTVNQYDSIFEAQAFALENAGQYSQPFRSRTGYHIVMLVNDHGVPDMDRDRNAVLNRIKRDERFHLAQKALLHQIKKEAEFTINKASYELLANSLNESFLTREWQPETDLTSKPWLTMGGEKYSLKHFTDYLASQQQFRTRRSRNIDLQHLLQQMYDSYEQQLLFSWEEARLEDKYPEFKALMREYQEGVLLFEVTRHKIWDKGTQDSLGLRAFFDKNRDRYQWEERAVIRIYRLNTSNTVYAVEIRNAAASMSDEDLLKKYNTDLELINIVPRTIEKSRFENYEDTPWVAGSLSKVYEESNRLHFLRIDEIKPKGNRSFEEARGYVMADYQDKLEKEWVKQLKTEYPVVIHEDVLNELVQK